MTTHSRWMSPGLGLNVRVMKRLLSDRGVRESRSGERSRAMRENPAVEGSDAATRLCCRTAEDNLPRLVDPLRVWQTGSSIARRARVCSAREASSASGGYPTSVSVSPFAGITMNSELRRASSRSATARWAVNFAPPTLTQAPTSARTMLRQNASACSRAISTPSASRSQVNSCSSRIVVAPSRGLQNVAKSCSPSRACAATCIAATSSAAGCHSVCRRRRGSCAASASAMRYSYRRQTAEKRASNPSGANSDDATLISDSSPAMPFRRRARALGPAGPGRPPRSGRFRMRSCASVRSTCAT